MEAYFKTIFEDVRHERSLVLLFKQSKFNDHEINIIKNFALEKLHRQKNLKEIVALDLLEKQIDGII